MELTEFKEKCMEMFEQKNRVEIYKVKLKAQTAILEQQKRFIMDKLEEFDLKKFDTGQGVVTRVEKFNAKVIDKHKLWDYLFERGILTEVATFNADSVNKFYKTEMEIAIENKDSNFEIPGVEVSSSFSQLKVTGAK